MAIDRTGITSLDTGASDITYSGNEGTKSPRQMADWDDVTPLELESLELLRDEFREDNNGQEPRSIQELMKYFFNKYGPSGVAKVERAITQNKKMASADPILQDEYNKYVFEMQEMGQEPISF